MPGPGIQIHDEATGALLAMGRGLAGDSLRHSLGGSVLNLVQDHLRGLDSSRANRMGGVRTHFYGNAAESAHYSVAGDGLVVSITEEGFAQRYFGGDLTPQSKKWLTIPARSETYGHRAGEFDLQFVPIRADLAMLVSKEGNRGSYLTTNTRGKRVRRTKDIEGGVAMFWLVKAVHQDPDPSVLPADAQFSEAMQTGVNDWLATIGARN